MFLIILSTCPYMFVLDMHLLRVRCYAQDIVRILRLVTHVCYTGSPDGPDGPKSAQRKPWPSAAELRFEPTSSEAEF